MAIHDIDKNGSGRTSPSPNSHDSHPSDLRMAHGTTSINPTTDATTATGYVSTRDGRILINDGTDNRIVLGIDPDGEMNLHISKPDEDVITDVFS